MVQTAEFMHFDYECLSTFTNRLRHTHGDRMRHWSRLELLITADLA